MPIFDQGYQHWEGRLSGHAWRWLTVTRHGVRAQMKNRLTRLVMVFALLPAVGLALVLVAWGLLEQQAEIIRPLFALFRFPREIMEGPRAFRVPIWNFAYHVFFSIEMFFSMILVVLVGPGLISQDLRFNAMPLYFSRPLRRIDYFLGKLGVIGFFLAAVTIVPAALAYVLGVLFSLDFSVLRPGRGGVGGHDDAGAVVAVAQLALRRPAVDRPVDHQQRGRRHPGRHARGVGPSRRLACGDAARCEGRRQPASRLAADPRQDQRGQG
jgi:hypothetical protein